MPKEQDIKRYNAKNVISFRKNNESHGIFSNMFPTPMELYGVGIRTSEHLYQALKFSKYPNIQKTIINERSPMSAKFKSRSFQSRVRADWMKVNVNVMKFCLQLKLIQNDVFYEELAKTGKMDIVEHSSKDVFWGAKLLENSKDSRVKIFVGKNMLGRLLIQLRDEIQEGRWDDKKRISIRHVPNLKFYDKVIQEVDVGGKGIFQATDSKS